MHIAEYPTWVRSTTINVEVKAMSNSEQGSLHGHVGSGLGGFSRLLDPDPNQPTEHELRSLAAVGVMGDEPDKPSDHPDPEENLYVPAGYTYFGQFVDHDITFDTTSTLDITDSTTFTNQRTPSFDLDNLYGLGPDAAPYMYQDGVKLVEGVNDLPRQAGRAIIGDPRNDENSIVCNMQMAFIRFHNAVVDKLAAKYPNLKGSRALFNKARNEVRWTYQRILVDDFLPRIVSNETRLAFEVRRDPNPMGLSRNESAYALFIAGKRGAMPLEFTGAAYRFGHSMVRTAYRLNANFQALIFATIDQNQALSLVGFQPLPPEHVINDWSILLPDPAGASKSKDPGKKDDKNDVDGPGNGNPKRLQFAYRIDTTFVNPLAFLPPSVAGDAGTNLGARNLLRGRKFQLPCGQAVGNALGVPVLEPKYLVYRDKVSVPGKQTFTQIAPDLQAKTPLWFYILAEAQMPMVDWWLSLPRGTDNKPPAFDETALLAAAGATATQLGETGGRIVLEVFNGLLDADSDSYRNHPDAATWKPLIKEFRLWSLLNCVFTAP
jgi:hypothetical protein